MLAYNKERELEFTFTVELNEGANMIALAATDVAGNTTTGELSLVYVPRLANEKHSPAYAYNRGEPIRLALHGSGILDTGQHRLFAATRPQQIGSFRLNLKESDISII